MNILKPVSQVPQKISNLGWSILKVLSQNEIMSRMTVDGRDLWEFPEFPQKRDLPKIFQKDVVRTASIKGNHSVLGAVISLLFG